MPYIELTDGSVSVIIADGPANPNYALREGGWAPTVAHLDTASLGGDGPWSLAEEAISHDVFADGGTGLTQRIQAAKALLLQAQRWAEGEFGVAPVRLRYQPDGSALASPLECAVLGMPGQGAVGLPESFNDYLMVREVEGAILRFLRRGALLGAEQTATGSAGSTPGVLSCTFAAGALPFPSPTWVRISSLPAPNSSGISLPITVGGLLLVTDKADGIQIIEAESGSGTAWTNRSETSLLARGGSVKRLTSTAASSYSLTFASVTLAEPLVQVWAVLRNSSGLPARASVVIRQDAYVINNVVATDWVDVPEIGSPFVLRLDPPVVAPIIGANRVVSLSLQIETTQASQVIDVDYLVVAAAGRVAAVAPDAIALPLQSGATTLSATLEVNPRVLELPRGDVRATFSGSAITTQTSQVGARGSPALHFAGGTIYAAYLAPALDYWRYPLANGSGAASVTLSAGRRPAYLIPE